ncbi:zinc finger protein ZAT5-like [Cornus florida]|uniref:zinc finger protein ZAT5-like n=1 Tax=Cornus florida TaxID=4283 RepID=UPI0028A1D277|nr:zinc finger protein ZAT5-like [Cornus florida]
MNMEVQEEAMVLSNEYTHIIIKGKRTKRPRPSSPLSLTMSTTSISSYTIPQLQNSGGGGGISDNSGGRSFDPTTSSPTNLVQLTQTTTEEEDMANCLILLAQGGQTPKPAQTVNKAAAGPLYECKTCNRCFSSFQALGGHRASHKKASVAGEEKKVLAFMQEEDYKFNHHSTTALSLQISNRVLLSSSNNKYSKVHECSICGAEFMSGQALGGHMRRHRNRSMPSMGTSSSSSPADSSQDQAKKPRSSSSNVLSLDLNLPAPEVDTDHPESNLIPFSSKGQLIVFSPSSLVDCHY